ncbi:MAG: RNA polymerase sigma factor [bacterium]
MQAEERFLKVYDESSAKLLRHITLRVGNQELAEDLLQETFMKAWRTLTDQNHNIDNLRAFIYKIASNIIIDHYRSKHKESIELNENIEVPSNFNIEDSVDAALAKKQLDILLQSLTPEAREIIIYKYIDQLRVTEISQITGKSIVNINVIAFRAMKQLKITSNERPKP